jgi:hypothetical protein
MTPYEMEEQLKNLHARTSAFEQILPTLATKDDLHLATAALQHEIETGFQEAKNHADRLNAITRAQIRLLAEATKEDLREMRQEMATKGDLQELRREVRLIGGHVRVIAKQVAVLSAPKRKKR